jgi:hypothetical protein
METRELAALLSQAYDQPAWHGPNLRSAVRGLSAEEALWRPGRNRPCIWELALHCAYWKHQVIGRLTGERTRFPRRGRNFPAVPSRPDEAVWQGDVKLLDDVHERLMEVVRSLSAVSLNEVPAGQRYARKMNITGIMMHDVYHAGQIRLLRKLQEMRAAAGTRSGKTVRVLRKEGAS